MTAADNVLINDADTGQPLSKAKRRVVFAGTPEFAATSLQALIAKQESLNIEIVAVYTQPDRSLNISISGAKVRIKRSKYNSCLVNNAKSRGK